MKKKYLQLQLYEYCVWGNAENRYVKNYDSHDGNKFFFV